MGMKDRSLFDKINQTSIGLTALAIHHCLSARKTDEFRVPPEFGTGYGAQRKCDTANISHAVNIACTNIYHHLDADFLSSSPEVQDKKINIIHSMIRRRIYSTGTNPVMAQPHNNHGTCYEDFLDYVPEELIEQLDISCNHRCGWFAATEASM